MILNDIIILIILSIARNVFKRVFNLIYLLALAVIMHIFWIQLYEFIKLLNPYLRIINFNWDEISLTANNFINLPRQIYFI